MKMKYLGRKPDFIIGDPANPYMLRWWLLPRNRWFNVYLHCVMRDDDDRALHDHPWASMSLILSGSYREITPRSRRVHNPGSVIVRGAQYAHRLVVIDGPVWTLFVTGPRVRNWGFYCPKGWVRWQDFVAKDNAGAIGRGCGELGEAGA